MRIAAASFVLCTLAAGCWDPWGMCGPTLDGLEVERIVLDLDWETNRTHAEATLQDLGFLPGTSDPIGSRWHRGNATYSIAYADPGLSIGARFDLPDREYGDSDVAHRRGQRHVPWATAHFNETYHALLSANGWTGPEPGPAMPSVYVC